MEPTQLIQALVALSLAAFVLGALCERLRMGALVGYLAAGVLLGPACMGLLQRDALFAALSDLGIALLLFAIGLEFSIGRLKAMGNKALLAAVVQTVVLTGVGILAAALFGLPLKAAVVIGAVIALSSTAVVLPMLAARAELDSPHGRQSLAILLVQDIAVIPLVLIIDAIHGGGSLGDTLLRLSLTVGSAIILVVGFYFLFHIAVPKLLAMRGLHAQRELPILLAVGSGLGSALLASQFQISPAIGSFLAGMLLADSRFAAQVRSDTAALRTLLIVLFFGSIGTLTDLPWIGLHLPLVFATLIAVTILKVAVTYGCMRFSKVRTVPAIATAIITAQGGEFGFVLLIGAQGRGALSDEVFRLFIATSMISLFLTTFLVRHGHRLALAIEERWLRVNSPATREEAQELAVEPAHTEVLIVGFGPAGQEVMDAFRGEGVRFHVVDLNPLAESLARARGAEFHLGDATNPDCLEDVQLRRMTVLVVALPDPALAATILENARRLAPKVRRFVRSRYHLALPRLVRSGADRVADEERLVGRALALELGAQLSGTPVQRTAEAEAPAPRRASRISTQGEGPFR